MFYRKTFVTTLIQSANNGIHVIFAICLAFFFGASREMDAYVAASNFIITLNMLFTNSQSRGFIPFVAKYKDDSDKKDIIASIMNMNIIIFLFVAIIISIFSKWIAVALAPGLDAQQIQTAAGVLRYLSLLVLFSNICGIGRGLLEYDLKFELNAFIHMLQGIVMIAVLFLLARAIGIFSVPLAHIISYLLLSTIFMLLYWKNGYRLRTKLSFYNKYIKEYFSLLVPIIVSLMFVLLIKYSDIFIASFFNVGSISYLNYCQRINVYAAIVGNIVSSVYFSVLSKLHTDADNAQFMGIFYKGLQTIVSLSVFFSLYIIVLAEPIVEILFERGHFSAQDSSMVAGLMRLFFLMLLCSPIGSFLSNAYFCRRKMKYAMRYSILTSLLNVLLDIILGAFFRVYGLAAASSIAFLFGTILQFVNINKVNPDYRLKQALKKTGMPFAAGLVSITPFTILLVYGFFPKADSLIAKTTSCVAYFAAYTIVFAIVGSLMKIELFLEIRAKLLLNLKIRKSN